MTRVLRRRRDRAARKGRLCADDAQTLDRMRRLPDFPHTFKGQFPIWTEPDQVQPILALIRRSGLAKALERRLRNHPGQESRISMDALLLAMMLAAGILRSYRRMDLCAVLNGLPSQIAFQLGLWDLDNPPPVSYHALCEQVQRLEEALGATWTGTSDTVRDLDWLCRILITAGIPRKYRKLITAVSLDSKIIESWGKSQIRMSEKDALAEHRLREREDANLMEPTLRTDKGPTTNKIGKPGSDGRIIRGHDHDARLGYKTGTAREKPRILLGYDLHLATAVPGAKKWPGDPDILAFEKAPPGFILSMILAPGSTNPGPIGLDLVAEAKQIAPGINEVIADRGYTNKRTTFCRELHRQGMNVVMDYNPNELKTPKTVKSAETTSNISSSTPGRSTRHGYRKKSTSRRKTPPTTNPTTNPQTTRSANQHAGDGQSTDTSNTAPCNSSAPNAPDGSKPPPRPATATQPSTNGKAPSFT